MTLLHLLSLPLVSLKAVNAGANVSLRNPGGLWTEECTGPKQEGKTRSRHPNLGSLQLLLPKRLGTELTQSKAQFEVAPAWPMLLGKEGRGERKVPYYIQHSTLHLVDAQEVFVE